MPMQIPQTLTQAEPAKKKFNLFLFIFSLPFLGGGLAAIYLAVSKISAEGYDSKYLPAIVVGAIFTGAGLFLMLVVPRLIHQAYDSALKRSLEVKAEEEDESTKPWLEDSEWRKGKVECGNQGSMYGLWIFSIIWCAISFGASSESFVEVFQNGNYGAAVFLIFPLIGVFFVLAAIFTTMRWKKFGASVFEISNETGYVGGELRGVIRSSTQVAATGDYSLKLTCTERITTGSGKNRTTKTHQRWEQEKKIPSGSANSRMGIPVAFSIPGTCFETDDCSAPGTIGWALQIHAPTKGVDYSANFRVPVYKKRQADG